jgi:peptide deformylase
MTLRTIMIHPADDDVLLQQAKGVTKINRIVRTVLKDMAETMYNGEGIGLAANQVGVMRRLIVIDTGDGLIQLVNPLIVKSSGEQIGQEGCLSIPNTWGMVKRPETVVVKAHNEKGKIIEIKGEGLLARVLCHEIDHLDGILFTNKAEPGTIHRKAKKRVRL